MFGVPDDACNRVSISLELWAASFTKTDELILAGVPAKPPTVPINNSSVMLFFPQAPGSLNHPGWGVLWMAISAFASGAELQQEGLG